MSLPSIDPTKAEPAKHVDSVGNDFDMLGVHAGTISTEVITLKVYWDGADKHLVAEPMGADYMALPSKLSIPMGAIGSPRPAAIRESMNL